MMKSYILLLHLSRRGEKRQVGRVQYMQVQDTIKKVVERRKNVG